VPLGQIAAALGYSEASAFTRTFRRGSSQTPTIWRDAERHKRRAGGPIHQQLVRFGQAPRTGWARMQLGGSKLMKLILVFVAVTGFTNSVHAQSGPTTLAMTCAQARGVVASQGAVVLRTGSTTFDRYVRDSSFCALQESAWPAWVRTADASQCPVGRICRPSDVVNGR
jgi:hypothetical protein